MRTAGALAANRRRFELLESRTALAFARGDLRRATFFAALAAASGAGAHPGRFVSPILERTLGAVAAELVPPWPPWRRGGPDGPGSVLHVMTRTETPGGHTNWVRRFVERDGGRRHSLVLLAQAGLPVPDDLGGAVQASGGTVHVLRAGGDLVAAAGDLRRIAARHDLVMVSTHPDDVVPALALSGREAGPAVARLDHSDHLFWVGAATSDVLVENRVAGARCAERRRGYPTARTVLLGLPVDPPRVTERQAARRTLGLDAEDFVVLSAGSPYKFRPQRALPSLADWIVPTLCERDGPRVVVVGPGAGEAWLQRPDVRGKRVVAVGRVAGLSAWLVAADVYLNSAPIGSDTAMLEAAAACRPVVMMQPPGEDFELVTGDPNDLRGAALIVREPAELRGLLRELRSRPEEAEQHARRARDAVRERMPGAGWYRRVEEIYATAQASSPMTPEELAPPGPGEPVDEVLAGLPLASSLRLAARAVERSSGLLGAAGHAAVFLPLAGIRFRRRLSGLRS